MLYQEEDLQDVFSAQLSQIQPLNVDRATEEAIADWHYWVNRGYQF